MMFQKSLCLRRRDTHRRDPQRGASLIPAMTARPKSSSLAQPNPSDPSAQVERLLLRHMLLTTSLATKSSIDQPKRRCPDSHPRSVGGQLAFQVPAQRPRRIPRTPPPRNGNPRQVERPPKSRQAIGSGMADDVGTSTGMLMGP